MDGRWEREIPQLSLPKLDKKLTHQLFRYPAKFHPPVCAALIQRYTSPGDTIFDPFVGSGTALVEAAVSQRFSLGLDVDPVAVQVSLAKTRNYDVLEIDRLSSALIDATNILERDSSDYERMKFNDISEEEYKSTVEAEGLWVPEIPQLFHWFRKYVAIDLARIKRLITAVDVSPNARVFIDIVFASIIRNSSNADPVPVSGLEYTRHMKEKDAKGRLVNPYALFRAALKRSLLAVTEFSSAQRGNEFEPAVLCGSATDLSALVQNPVDAVITSPPYHNAVDYYRRHQLEMFWLGLTQTQTDRLALLPDYIGRPRVARKDPLLSLPWVSGDYAADLERRMSEVSKQRATDFRHYVTSMSLVFTQLSLILPAGAPAVVVVGHSTWNGEEIATRRLLEEITSSQFSLEEELTYPLRNRYMSYTRHNSASIDTEYVLTFKRL